MVQAAPVISKRKKQLAEQYIQEVDKHVQDLKEGKTDRAHEIRDLAKILHVHPVHLSNTIKEVTGRSTCDLYEERLLNVSKALLLETDMSVAAIARQLTYDPSNFTKFFKHYTGTTPKKFRDRFYTTT
ncbi:helix-turn-helix transcriptional regulator [Panacibacter sp. DH6]|uniref:Helix-turn-helix transcriptional regulator n=1 Tax=Panacibacter microcysteis TaxID=2793269 RepID=A0A931GZV2_9BACT|nr:helix-turn-helix transcriptional regulator [Panacibacter microcysteis]MBG9378431.1 helix-turn-helix transcriptional regulator [Panacibacter microcysteis]